MWFINAERLIKSLQAVYATVIDSFVMICESSGSNFTVESGEAELKPRYSFDERLLRRGDVGTEKF